MEVSHTWQTSERAVNAFDAFCLDNRWIFVPVPQSRDFGKDGYVDVTEGGSLTGELFAVQVKGGDSYRAGAGGYRIPVGDHGELWGQSAVPVIGVVQDVADTRLRWVNLTAELSEDPTANSVWVDGEACLDEPAERERLLASVRATLQAGNSILLSLGSLDHRDQEDAVWECFALARKDARALIALRRIFLRLGRDAQRAAVLALSLCTPHPDVFWTKTNWLQPPVQNTVRASMRWSPEEAGELLRLIPPEEGIARGTFGQSVYHLLAEDPNIHGQLRVLLDTGPEEDIAWWAVLLYVYWSDEQWEAWEALSTEFPWVTHLPFAADLQQVIRDHGYFTLW